MVEDFLQSIAFEGDLMKDTQGYLRCETLVVLLTGCDDKTRHVEGSRRDDILFVTLFIITVRTVLRTGEHHTVEFLIAPPGHDVHHRLWLSRRQGFIEPTEQLFITILRTAADEQRRTGIVVYQREVFMVVETDNLGEVARESLPRLLQGQYAAGACLEMGMVGRRGPTERTIVKDHHLRIFLKQLMYLAIRLQNPLRLMLHTGDGEVLWQDGERVHQQFILVVDDFLHLFLRTVLFTEETRSFGDGLLVNLRPRRNHTGRIPLHLNARRAYHQFASLHTAQVVIALTGSLPLLQLTVEEALQRRVGHQFLFALVHLLSSQYLERTQTVLIEIIGIDLVDAQGSVAIASPTATEIKFCIDSSDAVVT